jgi:hypothetical protein
MKHGNPPTSLFQRGKHEAGCKAADYSRHSRPSEKEFTAAYLPGHRANANPPLNKGGRGDL